jgi:hypothetical protein
MSVLKLNIQVLKSSKENIYLNKGSSFLSQKLVRIAIA